MLDAEGLKSIELWAEDGDRTDPEDYGIVRAKGWDQRYEQVGSGFEPEYDVWNQLQREQTGFNRLVVQHGLMPWDARVQYLHHAFVFGDDGAIYISLRDSRGEGPTDPDSPAWRAF